MYRLPLLRTQGRLDKYWLLDEQLERIGRNNRRSVARETTEKILTQIWTSMSRINSTSLIQTKAEFTYAIAVMDGMKEMNKEA